MDQQLGLQAVAHILGSAMSTITRAVAIVRMAQFEIPSHYDELVELMQEDTKNWLLVQPILPVPFEGNELAIREFLHAYCDALWEKSDEHGRRIRESLAAAGD